MADDDGTREPDDNGVNWRKQPDPPNRSEQGWPAPPPSWSGPQSGDPSGPQQGWSGPSQGGYRPGASQGGYQPGAPQGGYQPGAPQGGYQPGAAQAWSGPPQGGYPSDPSQAWSAPPNYGSGPPMGVGGYPVPSGLGEFPRLPPGVEPASHGRRIGAYFLAIPLILVTLVIGYFIWGLVLWGKGTSPALRLLGMRCVDARSGEPVTFGRMALRDIVGGIVQGILGAITGLVSFVLFLSSAKRQTLPDLIGTTVVVYDPNRVMG